MKFSRSHKKRRQRKGAAALEFAVCAPLLLILTIGTLDLCSMLFLKETITLASYEGARRGIGRGNTNQDAKDRVVEFLNERGVVFDDADVVLFTSPGFDTADTLENVRVNVRVPIRGNLLIPSAMFNDGLVTASCTMRKEYRNLDP